MSIYYEIPIAVFSVEVEDMLLGVVKPSSLHGGVSREGGLRRNKNNTKVVFSLPELDYPEEYLVLVKQFKRTKEYIEALMSTEEWVNNILVE